MIRSSTSTSLEQTRTRLLEMLLKGECCRLMGPLAHGKTELIHQIVAELKARTGYQVIYWNLERIGEKRKHAFDNEQVFFDTLAHLILHQSATEPIQITTAAQFQTFLLNLTRVIRRPLVLIVDDIELVPPNLIASLLSVLRAVYISTTTANSSPLRIVISSCIRLSELEQRGMPTFESISKLIMVSDPSPRECQHMIAQYFRKRGIAVTEAEPMYLTEYCGCDHFLIHQVLDNCLLYVPARGAKYLTREIIDNAVQRIIQSPLHPLISNMVRPLESDSELLSYMLSILDSGSAPVNQMPGSLESPNYLDLSSMFVQIGREYRVKSRLWTEILRQHFSSLRRGLLYAGVGQLNNAFAYLGKAVQEGSTDARQELYAWTTRMIYASKSVNEAFSHLVSTLRVLFPKDKIQVYRLSNNHLERMDSKGTSILMSETNHREVQAMGLQRFSIEDRRLYVPLYPEGRIVQNARPVGLVCLNRWERVNSDLTGTKRQYRFRGDDLQLLNFLHQAASALVNREQNERETNLLASERDITEAISMGMSPFLEKVLHATCTLFEASNAVIYPLNLEWSRRGEYLFDGNLIRAYNTHNPILPSNKLMSTGGLARYIIERQPVYSVPDVQYALPIEGHTALSDDEFIEREGVVSFVAIRLGDLKPVGVLFINWMYPQSKAYLDQLLPIMQSFATYVGNAFINARQIESWKFESSHERDRKDIINTLITSFARSYSIDVAVETLLREIKRIINYFSACYVKLDQETDELVIPSFCREFYRVDVGWPSGDLRVPPPKENEPGGIARRAIKNGVPTVDDVGNTSDYIPVCKDVVSQFSIPIVLDNTSQSAAIVLESDSPLNFSGDDMGFLISLADVLAVLSRFTELVRENQENERAQRLLHQHQRDAENMRRLALVAIGIVHNVRKPIISIPALINHITTTLENQGIVTQALRPYVNALITSSHDADRLSGKLKRVIGDDQKQGFEPQLIDAGELIDAIVRKFHDHPDFLPDYKLQLKLDACRGKLVLVDREYFDIMLTNLLSNAFQHAFVNTSIVHGAVGLNGMVDHQYFTLEVRDNGRGIPDDLRHEIFEPWRFQDYHNRTNDENILRGLGLFIAHHVAILHHGDLSVENNRPDAGCHFTVKIPIEQSGTG